MIVDQLVIDFYNRIKHLHVLLLTGMDGDSVCACKILQNLFKSDNTQYTLVPVAGKGELQQAFLDHMGQVKVVVLINCGGSLNILEHFEPDDDIEFFIIDSHRPLELDNVYNEDRVFVVINDKEELDFPQFDDVYGSDMESENEYYSDEEDYDGEPNAKRSRAVNTFEKRKKKHLWKKKREEILFKYKEFNHHGTASSLIMHQLSVLMSRESNEVVWWTIVGLTEQYLYEKIDRDKYIGHVHDLQPHVLRLNRRNDEESTSINSIKISFENELRLILYRHWTIYDSLCHSSYVSCRFKIWLTKGQKKFLEFLADMGLPLAQCKQNYTAMDVKIRENLKDWIIESSRRYEMDDIIYSSFVLQMGYKHQYSAADMVWCITAFLEYDCGDFLKALDVLTKGNLELVNEGLALAKQQQMAIVNQVHTFIDTHQVVCAGPFIYAYVAEGTPHAKWFSNPNTLGRLVRYLRETWTAINKKSRDYPFIVCSPKDQLYGTCVTVGIPPFADDSHKSEFHNAFKMAADRIKIEVQFSYFDSSVVKIKVEDRGKFLDALSALSL